MTLPKIGVRLGVSRYDCLCNQMVRRPVAGRDAGYVPKLSCSIPTIEMLHQLAAWLRQPNS
jgi:hypothetical protein